MINIQPINFKSTNSHKNNTGKQVAKYGVAGLTGAGIGYGISSFIKNPPITEGAAHPESTKYGNYLYKHHNQAEGSRVLVQHKNLKPDNPKKAPFIIIGTIIGLGLMGIYDYIKAKSNSNKKA